MQIDKVTLYDLSIFDYNEEQSLIHYLNFCKTVAGRSWLGNYLRTPLSSEKEITERQRLIQKIISVHKKWPATISNGSVLMIEKFYESHVENIPSQNNIVSGTIYKILNAPDFSLVKYSVTHFIDFLQGMSQIHDLLEDENNPTTLKTILQQIRILLSKNVVQQILKHDKSKKLSITQTLNFAFFIRHNYKQETQELIEIYSKLDAFYSMGMACVNYKFSFPKFTQNNIPHFNAQQLYHPLLQTPVAYNISLNQQQNFFISNRRKHGRQKHFYKICWCGSLFSACRYGRSCAKPGIMFF